MEIDISNIKYKDLQNNYRIIGEGSGRVVYDLENGYVIKAAKNKKGISQNKVECHLSSDSTTDLFSKVLYFSDDFKYIIMQKAEKLKSFMPILDYYKIKNKNHLNKIEDIQYIISRYHLNIYDISSPTSWGIINGLPKIIDYGLTDEVFNEYYLKERLSHIIMLILFMHY